MTECRELLSQVQISVPCHLSWDSMSGDDRTRFCGSCKLNVYNVAGMTRPEAEALLRNANGRVCLRIYRRPDGTILTANCASVLWRKSVRKAGFAIAAALTLVTGLLGAAMSSPRGLRALEQFRDSARAKIF